MNELHALGFGPFFERQLQSAAGREPIPARIAAEHRGAYEVWSRSGASPARLAGRLRLELEQAGLPGVGDWVALRDEPAPDRAVVIDRVLERRTVFTRAAAGREARVQVVAANVDIVFAVCGLDADFNVRRIERYLTRIWASGAQPVVILNKGDICQETAALVADVERHCVGVPIHAISALHASGVEGLRQSVRPGVTVALVGSSGAGKSTLVNALIGEARLATGEVRARDGRGRHVTTRRQLVPLPGGGVLLDTPGMRELQLVDQAGIDAVFDDIAALAARCRFRDCRHDTEPRCAAREAVETGQLPPERLEHYRKLEREARAFERRNDERLRRQSERMWGRLSDEVAQLRRWKGGKP